MAAIDAQCSAQAILPPPVVWQCACVWFLAVPGAVQMVRIIRLQLARMLVGVLLLVVVVVMVVVMVQAVLLQLLRVVVSRYSSSSSSRALQCLVMPAIMARCVGTEQQQQN